ncbi:MAG TPA: alpha/beta hydrolase [Mesorhizobium sp.]|jgi:phospholipase/carboxylesterase|nr:alpha/beta hydrolase [Mesorhizobium sp.]
MSLEAYSHILEPGAPGSPLLVLLHGTGGDERQFVELGRALVPGATLLSPRGDVLEHGAARFFRRTGEGVYDMDDLSRASAKMAGFVAAHRERSGASMVLGLGYSNGANILASALFARPDLWDAAVLLHPLIPFQPDIRGSLQGKPILITAGERDPICPPALTRRLAAWLEEAGAALRLEWHPGGHELRQNEIAATAGFLERFRTGEAGAA